MIVPSVPIEGRVHLLSLARLVVRVTWYLVVSSAQVAWLAVRPARPPLAAVLRAQLNIKSDLVLALAVRVLPVYIAKQRLDTFATELIREAEISGEVGGKTSEKASELSGQLGIDPQIVWSKTGRIQLNEEVSVTLTYEIDLGLFAGFGSFPITLRADATGKSEVYWK